MVAAITTLVIFELNLSKEIKKTGIKKEKKISSQQLISQKIPSDWKTYLNSNYRFKLKHPKDWTMIEREKGTRGRLLNSSPCYEVEFYTFRNIGPDLKESEAIMFWIGVYGKSTNLSLKEWVLREYRYQEDLSKMEEGDIKIALKRGYDFLKKNLKENTPSVISREYKINDVKIYEIGEIIGGHLWYSAYLTNGITKYIYEIGVALPLTEAITVTEIPASQYAEIFNKIVSSFNIF